MPRHYHLQTNFVAGEIDPLLLGRSDFKHYYNGAERLRNAIVSPQGRVSSRPGTRFLWEVPEVSPGVQSNVKMCEFQFNTEQTYLIVFHDLTITIFRHGVVVATLASPYASGDLVATETAEGDLISSGIYWTQSKDTLLIFHEGFPIQELKRAGSHASWTLGAYALRNLPRYDFGAVYTLPDEVGVDEVQELEFPAPGSQGDWTGHDTFTLILEDEESDNISFSNTVGTMNSRIQDALRAMKNTSDTGITVTNTGGTTTTTVFTVTFSGDDGSRSWGSIYYNVKSAEQVPSIDIIMNTKGQRPGEVVFSATQGYPRCGLFFQGRLWVAGTPSLPHWVWASRAGDTADFNSTLFRDDYGIAVPADTSDVPAITACFAGRHLQFFSRSGEFYIPVSDRDAVTPGNVAMRRSTSRGCKPGLRVWEVDGATHFVQRRGAALREFIFADAEQAYTATNISLLAPHLMRDPVDFALRRSTSTTDADYEFFPNSDGTMTVFCTLRTQEVNAMSLWKTEGDYKAVGVVLDTAYFAVSRVVDGSTVLYIEEMDDSITVDCALTGGAGASATVAHLPNTSVEHLLDGAIQQPITANGAGLVTFARSAVTDWVAGLKFAIPDADYPDLIWLAKTLPLEIALPEGTALGRKRRVVDVTVRLSETSSLMINGDRVSFQSFGASLLDQAVPPFTGIKKVGSILGWDYEGSVVIGSDQSLKGSVLALAFGVGI